MATTARLQHEFNNLRQDAAGVLSAITDLSKQIAEEGAQAGKGMGPEATATAEEALNALRSQLENIGEQFEAFKEAAKEHVSKVDAHVKMNPYLYLAGFFGLGALLGKFFGGKPRATDSASSAR